MDQKTKDLNDEIRELIRKGSALFISMCYEQGEYSDKEKKEHLKALKYDQDVKFIFDYEPWYTLSRKVIVQLIPERVDDFDMQYKVKNRKNNDITIANYTISDYIIGLTISKFGNPIATPKSAFVKLQQQLSILKAAHGVLNSKLARMREIAQADVFDSELDAAKTLNKNKHTRAAGAVSGVVLERHLKHVCNNHIIALRKQHPTIADCNEALKNAEIIDIVTWRFIQHLADIRNLCDHAKQRDPTQDEVSDLIVGVDKIIKTVF